MPESPILRVEGLSVGFMNNGVEHPVVKDVSFHLMDSETIALVGESGSGKTVTALSLIRLIPEPPGRIMEGKIVLSLPGEDEQDLASRNQREMQKIRGLQMAMVFQEPMTSLNPVLTCGKQVAEGMEVHLGISRSEARKRVLELFREVRLPDPEKAFAAYPHQLSGGQKQRVMIAMAISCDPRILLADEPTTALDVTVQKAILDLLKSIQIRRRMSIIFITHDLGLVAGFADRVLVMNKGVIVEEGRVEEVFHRPAHPYTRGLLACRPPLDRRPQRLHTVAEYLEPSGIKPEVIIGTRERVAYHAQIYHNDPVLIVEKAERKFGHHIALEEADVKIYKGETLGVVGESGSGKTTLARVMLHLIPPGAGRILYRGLDISQMTGKRMKFFRKQVQIIFQDPYSSLNPRLTAGEAVTEPMKVHGLHGDNQERLKMAAALFGKVGLNPEHLSRYPHEFSGGQRQRICIARALAVEPELIICDESVSALDVSVQAQVLNLLNDLKSDLGLTYIFISHDLSVVKYMADRLIVMKNGRIVETGEADHVYRNPASSYTRELLDAIPGAEMSKRVHMDQR